MTANLRTAPVAVNGDATLTDSQPLATQPTDEPSLPAAVGRFQIRSRLGEGAFGIVYLAHDPQLDRDVALKIAKPFAKDNRLGVERFLREATAAARLRHPYIVPVYDAGRDGDRYYIASAFIAGRTLEEAVAMNDLDYRRSTQIVLCLAEALRYAHGQGVVHRDVKPANVMLDEHGQPLLTDFGLAARPEHVEKLTQIGAVLGTPLYTAPEQATGLNPEPSPVADQYSLGVLLFELLTGRPPFAGTPDLLRFLHQDQPPPMPSQIKPDLPRDLEAICLRCLNKNPAERYADCRQLADALRRFLDGKPLTPREPGLGIRMLRWRPRRPRRAAALAAGLVAVVALIGVGFWWNQRTSAVETVFAVQAGGQNSNAVATSVATDSEGFLYVAGQFDGGIFFGPAHGKDGATRFIESTSGPAAFVAKYGPQGDVQWVEPFGGKGRDEASVIAVDQNNKIYVAGHFDGTLEIDTTDLKRTTLTCPGRGIFLLKMDTNGGVEWACQMAGDGFDFPTGLALDKEGNIHLCGQFRGVGNFNPRGAAVNMGVEGKDSAFAVKVNPKGELLWARYFGGDGSARAEGIAVNGEGDVYTTGHFSGTVDFKPMAGGQNLVAVGAQQIFMAKLTADGTFEWVHNLGGSPGNCMDIKVDAEGNLFVAGVFHGRVQFGSKSSPDQLVTSDYNLFVAKLKPDGQPLWARQYGPMESGSRGTLAVNSASEIYVAGCIWGTVNFKPAVAPTSLTSAGGADACLIKLDAAGFVVWAHRIGGTEEDCGTNVAVDGKGGVFFCGYFNGSATFGTTGEGLNLTSRGKRSMFLCRLIDRTRLP